MKLYVMRHGPAEDVSATGRDADRALTASGRDRVRSVAKALEHAGESPRLIFTSPLARALQTAEIVAAVTNADVVTRAELGTSAAPLPLLRQALSERKKRVMVVGHEPDLSALVAHLVGRGPEQGMLKALVVGVALHFEDEAAGALFARLRFVLDPKTLELAPDART